MNRENDFKERSLGVWTWLLWAGLLASLTAYIVYSTHELWPELFWMALLGAVAIGVCSWYVTGHTREVEPSVRQKAIIANWLMLGAMVANVGLHGAASRDVANVNKLRAEQKEEQDRAAAQRDRDAARMAQVLAAQRDADKAATRRAEAEASLARQAGTSPRIPHARGKAADLAGLASNVSAPAQLVSAAKAADGWFWWVFIGFLVELIAGIAGSGMVHHARVQDNNANGIPDFVEKLFALNPAIVEQRFPDYYRILTAKRQMPGRDEFPRELDVAPKE